ncbi:MAG: ABC transporter ATP-binding protein, partial [Spirochaetia bacterium]|nr:ABC transporter ATP-binding protein [Spirochaetia bacterium]
GFLVVIITGKTGKYFIGIQKQTAQVNGYVEEYIAGQKVVKVFCHEKVVIDGFNQKNEELRQIATKGSTYAQILMPLLGNLSYLNYAVVAIGGSSLIALGRMGSMAAGIATLVMFLQLARQIGRPVAMISQQFNGVMMALAGAKRVFDMMDEPVETDEGYVTLVNVERDESGEIKELTYEYDLKGTLIHSTEINKGQKTERIERYYTNGVVKSITQFVDESPVKSTRLNDDGTSIVTLFEEERPYADVTYASDGKRVLSIEYRKEQ